MITINKNNTVLNYESSKEHTFFDHPMNNKKKNQHDKKSKISAICLLIPFLHKTK